MINVVDARGLACPLPVVNTKKAIEKMKSGDSVEVLVDNEIAVQNLSKFATQRHYGLSAVKKSEKEYKVVITLDEGEIAETGTYEELMALKGKFYELKKLSEFNAENKETE